MEFSKLFPLISFLIIVTSISGRILFLRSKGIVVTSKKSENVLYKLFLYPVFGLFFLLWIFHLINIAFQLQVLPSWLAGRMINSKLLSITGYVLTIVSVVFLNLSLLHFKKSLRFGLDRNNLGELVTSGVFSFSRNPFFLSIILYFTGLALIHPSLFFIIMALMSIFSIHYFILKEEKFLKQNFGNEYISYISKVRRYI